MHLKRKSLVVLAAIGMSLSIAPAAQAQPALPELPQLPIPLPAPNLQAPPVVNADVRENYVSLGDSLAANPTALDIIVSREQKKNPNIQWPTIRDGYCAQGLSNFPKQTAEKTGLRLVDYSCGGSTAYVPASGNDAIPHNTLTEQVDRGLADGAINGDTKLVSITIGVNDLYQPGNGENVGQEERKRRYHETVTAQINRVKAAAPNAKVVMLGLPDQTDGFNHTCATNLLGVVSHWYFPIVPYYQDELREEQRNASAATGSTFLDMVDEINVPKNNNGCVPQENRLSAAVFDDAPHNLTFHLTDAGHVYYANRLNETYRA